MTECKMCRALECRREQSKGYFVIPARYSCALGHSVKVVDNKAVCKDSDVCIDKTTRRKKCGLES